MATGYEYLILQASNLAGERLNVGLILYSGTQTPGEVVPMTSLERFRTLWLDAEQADVDAWFEGVRRVIGLADLKQARLRLINLDYHVHMGMPGMFTIADDQERDTYLEYLAKLYMQGAMHSRSVTCAQPPLKDPLVSERHAT